jgi:hypothetical protein
MTTMKPGTQTVLPLTAATDYRTAGRKAATLPAWPPLPVPAAWSCRLPPSNAALVRRQELRTTLRRLLLYVRHAGTPHELRRLYSGRHVAC